MNICLRMLNVNVTNFLKHLTKVRYLIIVLWDKSKHFDVDFVILENMLMLSLFNIYIYFFNKTTHIVGGRGRIK